MDDETGGATPDARTELDGPHSAAERRSRAVTRGGIIAIAVLGALVVTYETRHGMATTGDSDAYLGMAENLRHGRGITMPFDLPTDRFSPVETYRFHGALPTTHFPPLYSILLVLVAAGRSIQDGARTLAIALIAVNVSLMTVLTARMLPATRRHLALTVPFIVAIPVAYIGGWVVAAGTLGSEPLFYALTLGTLLALSHWIERHTASALRLAVGLTAAAMLTRHVGWFLVPLVGGVVLVTESDEVGRRRAAAHASVAAAVAAVPWAAVMVWGALAGGAKGGALRELALHPMGGTRKGFFYVVTTWLLPGRWDALLRESVMVAIVIGAVSAWVWASRHPPIAVDAPEVRRRSNATLRMVLAALALYVVTVLLARALLDASIPIDDRILSPMRPLIIAVLVAALGWATVRLPALMATALAIVVTVAVVQPSFSGQRSEIQVLARAPRRRAHRELDSLRAANRGALLFASFPGDVFAATGLAAIGTPKPVVLVAHAANQCYLSDFSEMVALLAHSGGYLDLTNVTDAFGSTADLRTLERYLRVRLVTADVDGALYRVDAVPGAPRATHLRCSNDPRVLPPPIAP